VDARTVLAVHDNAAWCDLVCRTHGIGTRVTAQAWTADRRAPMYYPDAVTLVPEPDVDDLLGRIDRSPECSIKDSYATLDLSGEGFHVLFEAEWIYRPPAEADEDEAWEPLRRPDDLREFGEALLPVLLTEPNVAIRATYKGDTVSAGVIAHRGERAVGISNAFPEFGTTAAFTGLPLVGYERGAALAAAHRAGFASVGPLRVWHRSGRSAERTKVTVRHRYHP
jgi:hypothetical protein